MCPILRLRVRVVDVGISDAKMTNVILLSQEIEMTRLFSESNP